MNSDVSQAMTGFGDGVSGGWAASLRRAQGTDGFVNKQSAAYKAALNVGTAWQIGVTGTFAAVNTVLSMGANLYESDWNNLGVDTITYGKSKMMSGAGTFTASPKMQIFGNVFGYAWGQTAARTILAEEP